MAHSLTKQWINAGSFPHAWHARRRRCGIRTQVHRNLEGEMGVENNSLAALFDERPVQWGLRGDPCLWEDLRLCFACRRFPVREADFEEELRALFRALTGRELGTVAHHKVEKYAHGGMSSGGISHEFWLDRALPLLLERLRAAQM